MSQLSPPPRPRLAFVSPMPPTRSGISSYSAELLPVLALHYEIVVIVNQAVEEKAAAFPLIEVRDVAWFEANAGRFNRILYQFGNSRQHQHMFDLLDAHPGVVVLHDFFLSGILSDLETSRDRRGAWTQALYWSHGYDAVVERQESADAWDVIWKYPCNGTVVSRALGVVVHSGHALELFRRWHGHSAANKARLIPHLRLPAKKIDRAAARQSLGISPETFVVCCFGNIGAPKLNHRLARAWRLAGLPSPDALLAFVGSDSDIDYEGGRFRDALDELGADRVRLTGWVDQQTLSTWLAACDLAVQLRANSRGESSGTVLDCMAHGVPIIANAHGSLSELPGEIVVKLPDQFTESALAKSILSLRDDPERRARMASEGMRHIEKEHDPAAVALAYRDAIEAFHAPATQAPKNPGDPLPLRSPGAMLQMLIDVSALNKNDLRTGVERAARALTNQFLRRPPPGYRVEPVYSEGGQFFYARCFALDLLFCPPQLLNDGPVAFGPGDVYFMPDLAHQPVTENRALYGRLRDLGVSITFMVHDLLPVLVPEFFPRGADKAHAAWLEVIAEANAAICVSRSVAHELAHWVAENAPHRLGKLRIDWSHHGVDLAASRPTHGLSHRDEVVLQKLEGRTSFLMVGTVEPRKGHAQVLKAFERLWAGGGKDALVVVGKAGWMVAPLLARMRLHQALNPHFFWIETASDEMLAALYRRCTCLVAASLAEGFGLPVVEAASHGLPILARDIPVFREITAGHALFFEGDRPEDIGVALQSWKHLAARGTHPRPDAVPLLTWRQSAERVRAILFAGQREAQEQRSGEQEHAPPQRRAEA